MSCDSVVTPAVHVGAGQRKLHKVKFHKLDAQCRKILHRGPPECVDWNQPWHAFWHHGERCVVEQMQPNGLEFVLTKLFCRSFLISKTNGDVR